MPLSHDEVVHGKGSLIGKMPGDDWQRFAEPAAAVRLMWAQPGKKLLFMGGELATSKEWNHDGDARLGRCTTRRSTTACAAGSPR